MSEQAALHFIERVRRDADAAARVRALGDAATLDDLVALGAAHRLTFTPAELQAAFRKDWTMRRLHHSS